MVHGEVSQHEHDRARAAYEAYARDLGGVDPVSGNPLREWDKVFTTVKRAFVAAVEAARTFDQRAEEAEAGGDPDVEVPEQADDEAELGDGYDDMTLTELQDEARGYQPSPLSTSGNKAQLVARLREADRAAREV